MTDEKVTKALSELAELTQEMQKYKEQYEAENDADADWDTDSESAAAWVRHAQQQHGVE